MAESAEQRDVLDCIEVLSSLDFVGGITSLTRNGCRVSVDGTGIRTRQFSVNGTNTDACKVHLPVNDCLPYDRNDLMETGGYSTADYYN